jgi:hypothetical protein
LPYCIDTSAILDGWKRYYPPDVFPSLWTNLEVLIASAELIAPDEVLHELAGNDEVLRWAKARMGCLFPSMKTYSSLPWKSWPPSRNWSIHARIGAVQTL